MRPTSNQRVPVGLPPAFTGPGLPSFVDFLTGHAPELLPTATVNSLGSDVAHGTTILALRFDSGILMAGDRRATAGNVIASAHMRKVFEADALSAVGIAGTAGIAVELVRLLQLELEHFEKIEGSLLSLQGKANRLSTMIRANLDSAVRGLGVLPLFAGWDTRARRGRIFSYDITGGCYEEDQHHSVGSGALFARGTLKSRWEPNMTLESALELAVRALVDVAEEDSSTAGPDPVRGIWPLIATVTSAGYEEVSSDEVEQQVGTVLEKRRAQAQPHRATSDRATSEQRERGDSR